MQPDKPALVGAQPIQVIRMNEAKARTAWDAYAAMRRAERDQPKLRDNDLWNALRHDARCEFDRAFGVLV